jgi:hypothetical protein
MNSFKTLKKISFILASAMIMISGNLAAQRGYIRGDFHQHTTYTDGSYSIPHMMKKNNEFGLDWWANSEHGGGFTRDALLSGTDLNNTVYWDQMSPNPIIGTPVMSSGHQVMWRWQSLLGFSFVNLKSARSLYPDKTIIQGYEMNVPGHEHGSVGIINGQFQNSPNVYSLAEFEYKFDASDADLTGGASLGWIKSTLSGHQRTLEAIKWLQDNFPGESWLVPAHPERKKLYTISDFRDMNSAGPDVCFGFESMPGHQKETNRGGYTTSADGGGTYGGCGVYAAEVGGLWDAMLSEGRKFWLFASSDFHDEANDFYPGEYQNTYTWVKDQKNAEAIVEGLRSGNSWVVEGDLIDQLEFNAQGVERATMGESLKFEKKIRISVILRDPESNNNHSQNPVLNHVDLIMGKITGMVDPSDPNYKVPKAPGTKVIARFDNIGGIQDLNGLTSIKWKKTQRGLIFIDFTIDANEACYFRLRGTNHGLNVAGETDGNGNPLLDFTLGQNSAEKAWNDLWFYSNPIFAITHKKNEKSKSGEMVMGQEVVSDKDVNNKEISLYPNPASQTLYFNNLEANTPVEIYDRSGNKVVTTRINGNSVNVSALQKGIYLVRIFNQNPPANIKFIKE